MNKLYALFRHNSGLILSTLLVPAILIYAYSCQSVVVSTIAGRGKISRPELVAEVDLFLAAAEAKFADLDRQDLVKDTIFNSVIDLAQGKAPNPIAVALVIGNMLGLGAVIDNVRKRTHINTLKGGNIHGQIKEAIKEAINVRTPPKVID